MSQATIKTLAQTERNGLFSLTFAGEALSEFEKFIQRFKDEADVVRDLDHILAAIQHMLEGAGFLERYFRPEGRMGDNLCALPIESGRLRLYCLRLSDNNSLLEVADARTHVPMRKAPNFPDMS